MAVSHKFDDELSESSEINLTPFIDVILVLLIIFMIAAQTSNVSQAVDLPGSNAKPLDADSKPAVVRVGSDGSLSVNDSPVSPAGLTKSLAEAGATPDGRVLLVADRKLAYEGVMDALDALRAAGYTHVALVGRERQSQ